LCRLKICSLIKQIYYYFICNPEAEPRGILLIKLNDTIIGNITGKKRRIDLTIQRNVIGQEILLAFKLYPWKSKIKKSELYSFKYLLEDINASKGVIIYNQELDTSILNFAQRNFISLCSLKDTESKIWSEEINIPVIWVQIFLKFHLSMETYFEAGDTLHIDIPRANFSYDHGKEIFTVIDYLNYKWTKNEIPHITDSLHILYLRTDNLKMKVNKNDWREVSKFEVYYTTEENYWLRYFEPEMYKAIENNITHDLILSQLEIGIEKFKIEEENKWTKLDKKELDTLKLKGLNLYVTANCIELTNEDIQMLEVKVQRAE